MNHILWRQTSHYYRISTEGRNRPAPSIGSPTLIWHLGVWRRRKHAVGHDDALPHDSYIDDYEEKNAEFFKEVFDFLHSLQERGLCEGEPVHQFKLEPIAIEGIANDDTAVQTKPRRFKIFAPQSASFALWRRDSAKDGVLNTRIRETDPDVDQALRVFVQFQSFQDHFTLTFYIDGAKLFTGHQIHKREEIEVGSLGERRTHIADHLDAIRRSSYDEIVSGAIDLANSDRPTNPKVTTALKAAADYLFEGIWKEFQSAFAFRTRPLEEQAQGDGNPFPDRGLIFVNQRGLMMSIRGLDTKDDEERASIIKDLAARNHIDVKNEETSHDMGPWRQHERSASATLGPVDVFDPKCGEPETVLKSLWPFLCQMTEHAARKDWVGCGIFEWRALFASTLGARAQPPSLDDDDDDVPMHRRTLAPERFFIAAKGEPRRRQIGRIVERLLSLETMRAIAFKNLGTIQNASLHLHALTMALDDILEQWAVDRKQIQEPWDRERKKERHSRLKRGKVLETPPPAYLLAEKRFYDELSQLNAEYETQLIDIAASLERTGPRGSGHLAYSIDESSYHIGEFDRMVPTLEIGNVAGWINYAQFADRGMRPTFNMIKNTGHSLVAAQERLKALTDVVQVSALIVQSDATRRNTDTLREIASNVQVLNSPQLLIRGTLGTFLFTVLVITVYYAGVMKVVEMSVEWIKPYISWLPTWPWW